MPWGWERHPVTRLRPALVDDGHGGQVPDWADLDEQPVGAFLYAPGAPVEQFGNREHGVQVAGTLYGPAGADVTAGDAVQFTSGRFRVVGEPQRWRPGTVLEIERWDG